MEQDLHSVINYERMVITPALLEYLGFVDVGFTIPKMKQAGAVQKLYYDVSAKIIIYFDIQDKTWHRSIKRKYQTWEHLQFEAKMLTFKNLWDILIERREEIVKEESYALGYGEAADYYCREREYYD